MTTTFVQDSFTDVADTTLANHVGEIGATWTEHPAYSTNSDPVITAGGRLAPKTSGVALWYASGVPSSADYTVSADVYVATVAGVAGVVGRLDTTLDTCYEARANVAGGAWELRRIVNKGTTVLVSVPQTFVAATLYPGLTLSLSGSTISFSQNATALGSVTDTQITVAGRVGIRMDSSGNNVDTANGQLDNLDAAQSAAPATGPSGTRALLGVGS